MRISLKTNYMKDIQLFSQSIMFSAPPNGYLRWGIVNIQGRWTPFLLEGDCLYSGIDSGCGVDDAQNLKTLNLLGVAYLVYNNILRTMMSKMTGAVLCLTNTGSPTNCLGFASSVPIIIQHYRVFESLVHISFGKCFLSSYPGLVGCHSAQARSKHK